MVLALQRSALAMKYTPLFVVAALFVGCADDPYDPNRPAFDANAPRVHIVSPARGTFAGDVTQMVVTGTVNDDSGRVTVTINGVPAAVAADGTWSAKVRVAPGTNLLHAVALDAHRNQAEETRAIVAGPMVSLDGRIANGIQATLSAEALNTLAIDTATYMKSGGLMLAAQQRNPFVDVGDGPDCSYAQASITGVTVGNADVHLQPTVGGLTTSTELDEVTVNLHLTWSVGCVSGSRDVVMSAQRVTVQGLLAIGVAARKLDVQLDHRDVQVTGFELQMPNDIPTEVTDMLHLDSLVTGIADLMVERLVVPIVDRSLGSLDDAQTLDIGGALVDVALEPTRVNFTPDGATIAIDTNLRARGDEGSFVFVANEAPALEMENGFELAVADDAANQLLTSMWSAKAFDTTVDLAEGPAGTVGYYYDSVYFQLAVPPHVAANGSPLELTTGDWIATFKRGNELAATVAIHAKGALYVATGDDGKLHMSVATPTVDVDVIDGADSLTKAQYQAIKAFALEHVKTTSSAAVAAIPLPEVGKTTLATPWIDPRAGYLFVVGELQGE